MQCQFGSSRLGLGQRGRVGLDKFDTLILFVKVILP